MGKANCNGWAKWVAGTAITVVSLLVGGYVAFDNDRAAGQATVQSEHGQKIATMEAVQVRIEAAVQRNGDKLDRLLERKD